MISVLPLHTLSSLYRYHASGVPTADAMGCMAIIVSGSRPQAPLCAFSDGNCLPAETPLRVAVADCPIEMRLALAVGDDCKRGAQLHVLTMPNRALAFR